MGVIKLQTVNSPQVTNNYTVSPIRCYIKSTIRCLRW